MKNIAVSKPVINRELGRFPKSGLQFKFSQDEHPTLLMDDDVLKSRK